MTLVGVIFIFKNSRCIKKFNFSRAGADQSDKPTDSVGLADFPSTEVKMAQLAATVG
jgi:hypothetical protein